MVSRRGAETQRETREKTRTSLATKSGNRDKYPNQLKLSFFSSLLPISASLRLCVNFQEIIMHENEITGMIVDAAYRVHTALGRGCWNRCTKRRWHTNWKSAA